MGEGPRHLLRLTLKLALQRVQVILVLRDLVGLLGDLVRQSLDPCPQALDLLVFRANKFVICQQFGLELEY